MDRRTPLCAHSLTVLGCGWFLVALLVGETQLLSIVPPPLIPATVLTLTSLLLVAYWKWSCLRARINLFGTRSLVALHLTRFVGIYFLYLHSRGELPGAFALAAGWGDIAIAAGAVVVLLLPGSEPPRKALWIWNSAGLVDILFVVVNAARLVTTDPSSMAPFMKLPLSFLPTFLVPMIIASHFVVFSRLLGNQKEATPTRSEVAPV